MNTDSLKELWKREEALARSGEAERPWEPSHLRGRYRPEAPPWDWETKVSDFVKPGDRVLDLRPESGEYLFSVGHPRPLPFPEESFEIVLSRGPCCDLGEIHRVLRKDGFFLTERTGGEDSRALAEFLLPGSRPASRRNLENELPALQNGGFRVMFRSQAYPAGRFCDIGALCFYAARHREKFPGFSVERCFDRLLLLQRDVEERGFVENREHMFLMIGKKKGK